MASKKNVLFIIADQFRADSLGVVGHPIVQTPNLDMLAREGVLFTQCFTQTAPCGPSRACMYTSRYACSHRSVNNKVPLIDAHENLGVAVRESGRDPIVISNNDYTVDPRILPPDDFRTYTRFYDNFLPGFNGVLLHEYDSPEWFEDLRQKGYPEHLLNHNQVHKPNVPEAGPEDHLPLRFPSYIRAEDAECRFVTKTAIDHMSQREEAGWFVSLNYIKPHPPRICSAPFNDMYDPADMPPAMRQADELKSEHPYLKRMYSEPDLVSERDLREVQANYWGMITELDAALGDLFQYLKDSGQWDNTLIVFTSDHGEYLGDHFLTGKGKIYDGTMRVPLIIRDPSPEADVTRGQQVDGFVESIDHAPTMLDYLDISIPNRFQGTSVLGRVRGKGVAKSEVYYERDIRDEVADLISDPDLGLLWVIRDDKFKYVHFADESFPALLFDLQQDPHEFTNLADDPEYLPTMITYCQKLLRWRMKHEDQRMTHWHARYKL